MPDFSDVPGDRTFAGVGGDLDLAVEDAEAGLLNDHGDGLARVGGTGTELLPSDGEGPVGSDSPDRSPRPVSRSPSEGGA